MRRAHAGQKPGRVETEGPCLHAQEAGEGVLCSQSRILARAAASRRLLLETRHLGPGWLVGLRVSPGTRPISHNSKCSEQRKQRNCAFRPLL